MQIRIERDKERDSGKLKEREQERKESLDGRKDKHDDIRHWKRIGNFTLLRREKAGGAFSPLSYPIYLSPPIFSLSLSSPPKN